MTKVEELEIALQVIDVELKKTERGDRLYPLLQLEKVRYEVRLTVCQAKNEDARPASLME